MFKPQKIKNFAIHETSTLMNSMKKRANYTNEEKLLLMNTVAKYKNIIECKKSNGSTWQEKNAAWDKITDEFNSQNSNVPRDKESLKKCYENKKSAVKKLAADNRREQRATGGGQFRPSTDSCLDIVLEITNKKTFEGLPTEFGGDSIHNSSQNTKIGNESEEEEATSMALATLNYEIMKSRQVLQDANNYENKPGTSAQDTTSSTTPKTKNLDNFETPTKKTNWKTYKLVELKTLPNAKLQSSSDRRRPKIVQPVHTSFLSKQYSEVASLKENYLIREMEIINERELREVEEFRLRKRTLELDIEIKELQLKKLRRSYED